MGQATDNTARVRIVRRFIWWYGMVIVARACLAFLFYSLAFYIGIFMFAGSGEGCVGPIKVFLSWGYLVLNYFNPTDDRPYAGFEVFFLYFVLLFILNTVAGRWPSWKTIVMPFVVHASGAMIATLSIGEGIYCRPWWSVVGYAFSTFLTGAYFAFDIWLVQTCHRRATNTP